MDSCYLQILLGTNVFKLSSSRKKGFISVDNFIVLGASKVFFTFRYFHVAKAEPSEEKKEAVKQENGEPTSSATESCEDKKEVMDEDMRDQTDEGESKEIIYKSKKCKIK